MVDALKRASARSVTAVIPYFGYARQDRRPRSTRVPISAKVVANLLEAVGVERAADDGPARRPDPGLLRHPGRQHLRVAGAAVRPAVARATTTWWSSRPTSAAWSAPGRWPSSSNCDLAIIDKRRPKANVSEVMHVIGEIEGRNCVIMDDMIDTAGTLVKAADVLKERGAKKVYAYCTHAVFSGPAIERIRGSQARRGRRHQHHSARRRRQELQQGPPAVGGLPVRRNHPPHLRRRVGRPRCSPSRTAISDRTAGFASRSPSGLRGVAPFLSRSLVAGPHHFGVVNEIRRL